MNPDMVDMFSKWHDFWTITWIDEKLRNSFRYTYIYIYTHTNIIICSCKICFRWIQVCFQQWIYQRMPPNSMINLNRWPILWVIPIPDVFRDTGFNKILLKTLTIWENESCITLVQYWVTCHVMAWCKL